MMKSIDHRRSDQGAMDGHYHDEQARMDHGRSDG